MDANRIAELEGLLSAALETVTVRRGQSEQLSIAQFRQVLQKCRTVYDPNLRLLVSACKPEIPRSNSKSSCCSS